MSNILRVRTEPGGEWTEIPAIQGEQGPQGEDGYSPTVTTTPIDGGTKVTITDKTGSHEFDVMNGESGSGKIIPNLTIYDILNRGSVKQYPNGGDTDWAVKVLKSGYALENNSAKTVTFTDPDWTDITYYAYNTTTKKWVTYAHNENVSISMYGIAAFITPTCYVKGSNKAQLQEFFARTQYNNTTSGLTATLIQDAIDELAARPTGVDEATVDQKITDAIAAITDFTGVSF